MILLFLLHIAITAICSLSGLLFYRLTVKDDGQSKPLVFYPVTGLIAITLVSQVAVLFVPVNGYFTICFLLFVLCLAFLERKIVFGFYRRFFSYIKGRGPVQGLMAVAIWLMILLLSAGPVMMDDTGSYHIQMIKWVNEYGTVPGIVNLHERFGFNSSWFTSISFFLPPAGDLNFYNTLNGVISAWFCLFLLFQLPTFAGKTKPLQVSAIDLAIVLILLLSFVCWPMIRGNGSTANYDFIATTLTLVLFIKILQQNGRTRDHDFVAELIIWPVYLFTVRIINYPLLLLSLYGFYLLIRNKEWRLIFLFASLSSCLFFAFVARNIILAGYPFYPSTAFNFFNVDWKADGEMITGLKRYIKYFNRVNEGLLDIEETEKLQFPGWIIAWFRYMFYYDKPVVIAGLSGLFLNLVFIRRAFSIYNPLTRFFIVVICAQLLSWFLVAPDPRFVYGCLLCGAMLLPLLLLKNKKIVLDQRIFTYLFICAIGIIIAVTILKATRNNNYRNFMQPCLLPQPPVRTVVIDNIEMRIPEKILTNWNARCYGTPLPCLYRVDPRLRARGHSIRQGFRLEK